MLVRVSKKKVVLVVVSLLLLVTRLDDLKFTHR